MSSGNCSRWMRVCLSRLSISALLRCGCRIIFAVLFLVLWLCWDCTLHICSFLFVVFLVSPMSKCTGAYSGCLFYRKRRCERRVLVVFWTALGLCFVGLLGVAVIPAQRKQRNKEIERKKQKETECLALNALGNAWNGSWRRLTQVPSYQSGPKASECPQEYPQESPLRKTLGYAAPTSGARLTCRRHGLTPGVIAPQPNRSLT